MKNKSLSIKIILCLFPFIAVALIYQFRDAFIKLGTLFPACPSYTFFDIYCPGCGNTRSVQHLLKGDILGSLKFNIVPILGILIATLAYLEVVISIFGKQDVKIIPRSRKFWIIISIIFSLYFIVRNLIHLF